MSQLSTSHLLILACIWRHNFETELLKNKLLYYIFNDYPRASGEKLCHFFPDLTKLWLNRFLLRLFWLSKSQEAIELPSKAMFLFL